MPSVVFTRNLQRHFPGLSELEVEGTTIAEIVAALERHHAGLADYIVDEQGGLRKHVNIFIDDVLITDRSHLSDTVGPGNRIHVIQALSGG